MQIVLGHIEFSCSLRGLYAGLLQVVPATRPLVWGGIGRGFSGSHSPYFLIAWNEMHTGLLLNVEFGQVALGHTVHAPL